MFLSNWSRPMFFYDEGAAGGAPASEQTPDAGASGGKTFTQEEVNRLVGDARKDGRSSGEKSLLESLGLKSADDLKGIVQSAREAEEKNKTELQKAQDAATQAASALEEERQAHTATKDTFTKRLLDGEIRIAASAAMLDKDGKKVVRPAFRKEALDDVTLLIDRTLITEKDGKFEGLDKALDALAKAKPYLLAGEAQTPKGTPPTNGQRRSETAQTSERRPTPTL